MKKLIVFLFISSSFLAKAATVDSLMIYSNSMHRAIKSVLILPASYQKEKTKKFPVVYLLHGAFGSYANWIKKVPHIQSLADAHDMIIVCPDGGFTSWYFDSPIDST